MSSERRPWTVLLSRQAERVLRHLPRDILARIDEALLGLEENPRPRECKRLSGPLGNLYALRVGDWRISYAAQDERLIVLVVEIAPRGAAYCRL